MINIYKLIRTGTLVAKVDCFLGNFFVCFGLLRVPAKAITHPVSDTSFGQVWFSSWVNGGSPDLVSLLLMVTCGSDVVGVDSPFSTLPVHALHIHSQGVWIQAFVVINLLFIYLIFFFFLVKEYFRTCWLSLNDCQAENTQMASQSLFLLSSLSSFCILGLILGSGQGGGAL